MRTTVVAPSRLAHGALALVAACGLLAAASGPVHAQRTDGEVSEELFRSLALPLEAALAGAEATGIVLRRAPGAKGKDLGPLQERLGNFFYDRGYDVHTIEARAEGPAELPVLDLEVDAWGFDYPDRRRGFLGLGAPRALRRARLGVHGRLEDPRDGRWLWKGSPRLVIQDWIPAKKASSLAADRPDWMAQKPPEVLDGRSPWWERGLMAGLLTGVVILYVDGTQ